MTTRKEGKSSQVLFLKGFGWCVGAACDVGIDTVLPGGGG